MNDWSVVAAWRYCSLERDEPGPAARFTSHSNDWNALKTSHRSYIMSRGVMKWWNSKAARRSSCHIENCGRRDTQQQKLLVRERIKRIDSPLTRADRRRRLFAGPKRKNWQTNVGVQQIKGLARSTGGRHSWAQMRGKLISTLTFPSLIATRYVCTTHEFHSTSSEERNRKPYPIGKTKHSVNAIRRKKQ